MIPMQRNVRRILVGSIALAAILFLAFSQREELVHITLDGSSPGRVFDGIGALSAGASSRLLMDYPEPQRGDILDFLFKPGFGASLHHLKVEIGGDVNSTDGTEPSHARSREELLNPRKEYYERGYEWWLMKEAKKRNPDIVLDILQWGAPGWIGDRQPGSHRPIRERFYSQDNADFVVRFIKGAETYHGLRVDYCGIWNETQYDIEWIKTLRRTLDAAGLKSVRIVAADQTPDIAPAWQIAEDILSDSALADAVHTIGAHYSSSTGWKHALKEAFASSAEAKRTGKPIWASEDGPWRGDWEGARWIAKIFNRSYVVGKMTKTITWSLITSYYDNLPIPGSGLMKANSPWSGYYEVQPAVWAIAHTTQFVQPGWRYLDKSCGVLPSGVSYVTLHSGSTNDWSMIIETIDAKEPVKFEVTIAGDLSVGPVQLWRTTEQSAFEQQSPLVPAGKILNITVEPNSIYSLTTTSGQRKGKAISPIPSPADFPPTYEDDFEITVPGRTPKYFSDLFGAFEVAKSPDGRGNALRQVIGSPGIEWPIVPHKMPKSILGSRGWKDYEVSANVWPDADGWVSIGVRFDKPWESGYWFKIDAKGSWELTIKDSALAQGTFGEPQRNRWTTVSLLCRGEIISPVVNEKVLRTITDTTFRSGLAGLGTGWNTGYFDNIRIRTISSTKR